MPKNVLVVEDADSMRGLIAITLGSAGYNVIEAKDGIDALEKINRRRIHLIFSDINMPGMDGITLLRTIKQNTKHKFIPVVMLTTLKGDEHKREGRAAGAKAWIVKPFKPETILSVAKKIIG